MVGAPKAGTTTLAADLAEHPRLWLPERKELGYFDVRWRDEPLDAYRAEFAAAPADALVGEATPTYLHAPGAMERLAAAVPGARLVVMVRDPVLRAWSHYWYNRTARLVESLPPGEAFARKPAEYLEPGRYGAHLTRVQALFAPDRVLVVVLDDLVADAAGTFRRTCEHLGVPPAVPSGVGRPRNRAYEVRSPGLRRQMLRFSLWDRLPFGLGFRLDEWNRRPLETPPMPDDIRAELRTHYADDTTALARLLDRDLPWSETIGPPR